MNVAKVCWRNFLKSVWISTQKYCDYLLREFKLRAEQYRDTFRTAIKSAEETYTLFGSRVKNLFLYYLDSRKVTTKDQVVDLLVSDRIKETLGPSCS